MRWILLLARALARWFAPPAPIEKPVPRSMPPLVLPKPAAPLAPVPPPPPVAHPAPAAAAPAQASPVHDVRWVQEALNRLGYGPLAVDGIRGPRTRKATEHFQHAHALRADGIAGHDTIRMLELSLRILAARGHRG